LLAPTAPAASSAQTAIKLAPRRRNPALVMPVSWRKGHSFAKT
jgi:hypothetical protein